MAANLDYQLQDLTGGIDNLGHGFPAGSAVTTRGGEAADNATSLKHLLKYWGGLALLVSLGVIGIPFLIYFVIRAVAVVLG